MIRINDGKIAPTNIFIIRMVDIHYVPKTKYLLEKG